MSRTLEHTCSTAPTHPSLGQPHTQEIVFSVFSAQPAVKTRLSLSAHSWTTRAGLVESGCTADAHTNTCVESYDPPAEEAHLTPDVRWSSRRQHYETQPQTTVIQQTAVLQHAAFHSTPAAGMCIPAEGKTYPHHKMMQQRKNRRSAAARRTRTPPVRYSPSLWAAPGASLWPCGQPGHVCAAHTTKYRTGQQQSLPLVRRHTRPMLPEPP